MSQLADFVGSTAALLNYVAKDPAKAFIVGTEAGILHQMQQAPPGGRADPGPRGQRLQLLPLPLHEAQHLEKLYLALRDLQPEITLDEETRLKALAPVQRMLALG